jgi:hypothetical protein
MSIILPFSPIPVKQWNDKQEKKKRIPAIAYDDNISELSSNTSHYSKSSNDLIDLENIDSKSDDTDEYDVIEHISSLMSTTNIDGSIQKSANKEHLNDMKIKHSNGLLIDISIYLYKSIKKMWKDEIERRKHYLIKDYEKKIKEFDEKKKKEIEDRKIAREKEINHELERREEDLKRVTIIVSFVFS